MGVTMGGRLRALRIGRRRWQALHQSRKRGQAGGRARLDPERRDAADALPRGRQKRSAVVGESSVAHQEINHWISTAIPDVEKGREDMKTFISLSLAILLTA